MKKSVFAYSLLLVALVSFYLFSASLIFEPVSAVSPQTLVVDREPPLQEWFDENGYAINVTADETGIESFCAGYYRLTILDEIAEYAPLNNLSWYPIDDGESNYIIYGENVTGDAAFFMADKTFGLCLGSPDGLFYTESKRNADEKDHALVFMNPNAPGYIIAWEDLWRLGDQDFQDLILAALTPVNVKVWYCPRVLNLKSNGRWITGIIKLPEGYLAKDVDVSSIMLNGTIPANQKHYCKIDCKGLHMLIVKFNRKDVIELIKNSMEGRRCKKNFVEVNLTLTGNFFDGQPFQGTNRIWIICPKKSLCRFSCRPVGTHAIPP